MCRKFLNIERKRERESNLRRFEGKKEEQRKNLGVGRSKYSDIGGGRERRFIWFEVQSDIN